MVDDSHAATELEGSICPWCSARYTGDPDTCPSCGAALSVDPATDSSLPGLTAIDPAAIVRAKTPVARPRSRLLSWISGDYVDDGLAPGEAGALAPPDAVVRREMLRLELEAEVANLQAEADAIMAEATVQGRPAGKSPAEATAAAAVTQEVAEAGAERDAVDEALDAEPSDREDRQPA
jgi:hypothetical protein